MTHTMKSFEELGSVMRKPKYSKGEIPTCKPISLRRLVEIIGSQAEAGRLIGISGNYISGCFIKDKVRFSYELAAKAVLMEMQRETNRPIRYLVEVPADKKELLVTFLNALQITVVKI